jgi:23S rRNA pseudouridine1911/1915/1917 synthase
MRSWTSLAARTGREDAVTTKTRFEVQPDDDGLRLDQVIPKHVPGLSRRKTRAVIDLGGVFVDKTRVKVAGRYVKPGQVIEVNVGGAIERANETPLAPRIVHTDEHIIVVDKPAGLVTAPTPEASRGDLLDQLSRAYGEVYLVHRIDLPTSGLLVFARTRDANKKLGDAFKMHAIDREYRAVAVGAVGAQTIEVPIDRKVRRRSRCRSIASVRSPTSRRSRRSRTRRCSP